MKAMPGANFALLLVLLSATPQIAVALSVYSNDFSAGNVGDSIGSEWSANTRINQTPGGIRFLGGPASDTRFGLSNDDAVLTLHGLPPNSEISLSFSLFIIDAWAGARLSNIFQLRVSSDTSASVLLRTSFSNTSDGQHYPDAFGGNVNPPQTGAAAVNALGYGNLWNGDSVYNLSFTIPNLGATLNFDFGVSGLVGYGKLDQQSWGLGKIAVTATPVPLPTGLGLMGWALGGLGFARRRVHR